MKKILMLTILGITIQLWRRISNPKDNIMDREPSFTTVGSEFYPPATATAQERKDAFNLWADEFKVSRQYVQDPTGKAESSVIDFKDITRIT